MVTEVATRFLPESEYPRWVETVATSAAGSVYALPKYLAALCAVSSGCFRILVAEQDERIVGGIALYERTSRAGIYLAPRLLLYYNGFVLAPQESKYPSQRVSRHLHILAALEQHLSGMGYARVRIKSRAPVSDARVFQSHGWAALPVYSYVVDISDLEQAWARMDKNARRLVNRCRKQGLTVTVDDQFDAFYRLHEQTRQRKWAPLYLSRDAFGRFFARLCGEDLCHLYHARLPNGRVIASQLVLTGPHPVTHTVCAAADAAFLNHGASAFLRWQAFEHLSQAGYMANDLTDAELNPVTHFKAQLGGELTLCLEISGPDSMRWRLNQFAASMPRRTRRLLSRARRLILRDRV